MDGKEFTVELTKVKEINGGMQNEEEYGFRKALIEAEAQKEGEYICQNLM